MNRSYWAWGFEDLLLDEAHRAQLAAQLGAVLGFSDLAIRPYPAYADARVREPRLAIPDAVRAFCTSDPRARAERTFGRGYPDIVRGFRGDFSAAPDLVAQPRDEAEVAAALAWAEAADAVVVPYGGGTSVVGGVECRGEGRAGVVCLDLRRLDRVLEIDPVSLSARIQAGATGPGLEAQLAEHGLTLRHFPQSFEFSTLGGWIATRAGGHFATGYTHIDDLVQSIRMITPSGPWQSARLPGSGAGPSPDRLVLGSEGILGVITEAWMRVFRRPRHRSKASVHFTAWGDAVAAVREIAQSRLFPANCRLLDQREALLNQVAIGEQVLLLGFESADHPMHHRLDRAIEIATGHRGRVQGRPIHRDDGVGAEDDSSATWRASFLRGPYLMSALVSMDVVVDTFETAITWDRFDALHADVIRSVRAAMKQVSGRGFVSCRFTHVYPDGPAPYYTFLCPGVPGEELDRWRVIKDAAGDALVRHGATITHHHAVGRVHRPWYDRQRPEAFARVLRAAKQELDPHGILNPGVLID